MHNDSIDQILLRHYGNSASAPVDLETRISKAVQREIRSTREQQNQTSRLRTYRLSRRKAIQLVALGTAGASLLSACLTTLQSTLSEPEASHRVYG